MKLYIELIPSTCHFSNVRTTIKSSEWDKIRFMSYESANNKCEICSDTGLTQGYKHKVECHEIWDYDLESLTQKLIGLISLCPRCHQVKHIGRAIAMGKLGICKTQLSKVNKWTKEQVEQHIIESFELYKERSKFKWSLDITILNEAPYELNITPPKNRIFEVKKYKKKKKRKNKTSASIKPKKRPLN